MRRTLVLGAAALVLMLSGCFAPTPTETTAPDDAVFTSGSSRTPAFAIPCGDVVPLGDLQAVYGDDLEPAPYREAGAQGSWEMQATALLQDGVLACAWAPAGEERAEVLILALDDATEGFERSEPQFLESESFDYRPVEVGDTAEVYCRNDDGVDEGIRCHWNVLAGEVWLSFYFRNVDESEVDADLAPLLDGALGSIVSAAIESVTGAARNAVDRAEPTLVGCNESLEQATVAEALGVPLEELFGSAGRPLEYALGSSNPSFGQVMWAYSYERLGYVECIFGVEELHGSAIVAPGAAWILTEPGAIQSGITGVDNLGSGTRECVRDSDVSICSVSVAVGQDLALVQMISPSEADAEHAALEIARILVKS